MGDKQFIELVDGSTTADPDSKEKVIESGPCCSDLLEKFCREVSELLASRPDQSIAFSNFTAAFDQFFKRQCRVADYGYKKLIDLFKAAEGVVQVGWHNVFY